MPTITSPQVVTRLCSVDEVPSGTSRSFEVGPHKICLVRIGDDFYAIGDRCSHADVSLAEGAVIAEDRQIECYLHGAVFDLESGQAQCLPATRPVPVYDVQVDGDDVLIVIT